MARVANEPHPDETDWPCDPGAGNCVPPEAQIDSPDWFAPVNVDRLTGPLQITGHIAAPHSGAEVETSPGRWSTPAGRIRPTPTSTPSRSRRSAAPGPRTGSSDRFRSTRSRTSPTTATARSPTTTAAPRDASPTTGRAAIPIPTARRAASWTTPTPSGTPSRSGSPSTTATTPTTSAPTERRSSPTATTATSTTGRARSVPARPPPTSGPARVARFRPGSTTWTATTSSTCCRRPPAARSTSLTRRAIRSRASTEGTRSRPTATPWSSNHPVPGALAGAQPRETPRVPVHRRHRRGPRGRDRRDRGGARLRLEPRRHAGSPFPREPERSRHRRRRPPALGALHGPASRALLRARPAPHQPLEPHQAGILRIAGPRRSRLRRRARLVSGALDQHLYAWNGDGDSSPASRSSWTAPTRTGPRSSPRPRSPSWTATAAARRTAPGAGPRRSSPRTR